MWNKLAHFVLKNRLPLLIAVVLLTGLMGYFASKVQLSYEFARAIPTDNPKYATYLDFKKRFGDDGNLLVIGAESKQLFQKDLFNEYASLAKSLKEVKGVEEVLSIPATVNLVKDSAADKFKAVPIFPAVISSQQQLDSCRKVFENLLFYKTLLYNPATHTYLIAVRVNKDLLNSVKRIGVVKNIMARANDFGKKNSLDIFLSGLPLVRTIMATRIADEMKWL
jgi:predicted RND superfamily exporter protein